MSKAKATGTAAETAVRDYLRSRGFPNAERLPTEGSRDRGDIVGGPVTVIEVKAAKELDLAGWVTEMEAEMRNADTDKGVVWIKRRMKGSPGDWYIVTTGEVFLRLLGVPDGSQ